ncbi:hypothetical protein AAMO2058_001038700 [Amorphochlora amoebiformis]
MASGREGEASPIAGIEECSPTCRWTCDDPQCAAQCHPMCKDPSCEVHCEPTAGYVTSVSGRPECQAVCEPAKCTTRCVAEKPKCSPVCKKPECMWRCSKPRVCPKPKCLLVCQKPNCSSFGGDACCDCAVSSNAAAAMSSAHHHTTTMGYRINGTLPSFLEVLDDLRHDAGNMCCPCARAIAAQQERNVEKKKESYFIPKVVEDYKNYLNMDPKDLHTRHKAIAALHSSNSYYPGNHNKVHLQGQKRYPYDL